MFCYFGIYPYEDMDSWEKFDETTLPPKESFYSNLNLEDISDEDYAHAQKVWDVFEINNWGEYHDLYVQSDTLLFADVYENFRNMSWKIWTWHSIFCICTRVSMANLFIKDRSKVRINNRLWRSINDWKRD